MFGYLLTLRDLLGLLFFLPHQMLSSINWLCPLYRSGKHNYFTGLYRYMQRTAQALVIH